MSIYVKATSAIKNNYEKFKQHLIACTGQINNADDFYDDMADLCNRYTLEDEIKSILIDKAMVYQKRFHRTVHDKLGENHIPTDKQLDVLLPFQTAIWITWSYFTFSALRYIYREYKRDWEVFLIDYITKIQWDEQCLVFVCGQQVQLNTIEQILKHTGMSLTNTTHVEAYRARHVALIELHNMPLTNECVIAAADKGFSNDKFVLALVDKLPLTSDTLETMIQIRYCTQFDTILKHVSPTQEHVKLACKYHRIDLIERLLNYRLTVDAECFELMFFTGNKAGSNIIAEAIDLFISAGYKLTTEDVVRLVRRKCYVRNITRFDFTFNEDIITACIMNDYYPYDLPFSIESLRMACIKMDQGLIERIIDSGVIPDRQCLTAALLIQAKYANEDDIIKLLMPYVTLDEELTYQLKTRGYIKQSSLKY